jgi:Ricin-type beta-trefoil lectin domain
MLGQRQCAPDIATMTSRRGLAALMLTATLSAAFALLGGQPASATPSIYTITNLATGMCLQPAQPADVGVQLVQQPCLSSKPAEQLWTEVVASGGKHVFINQKTFACMDAHGPFAPGTPVDTWFCGNISNQRWTLSTSVPTPVATKMTIGSQCLDLASSFPQAGTPVQISTCITGRRAQAWFVIVA